MTFKSTTPPSRDWLDKTRVSKAQPRPVVVVDIGHGWIPDAKDPTRAEYDTGAVYDPAKDPKLSDAEKASEGRIIEHEANEALARAIAKQLRARGFAVQFTTHDSEGNALYNAQEFPKDRVQFRLNHAHTLRDAHQQVVGYISVHHDSGFEKRQSGAAVALHIAAPESSLLFAKSIAGRVHGITDAESEQPFEPLVGNAEAYRNTYVGKFSKHDAVLGTTHDYARDMEFPPVLRHGTNIIRANENHDAGLNSVKRGLGDIPAVLIERAVLWNPHDRRVVRSEQAQTRFAHQVADGVAQYWDEKCRGDATLTRRRYVQGESR